MLPRIEAIAASGVFSNNGPQIRELEARLAKWLGVQPEHLVVTSNATVALSAAVFVSPAKRWQIPGWSFPATAHAPLLLGREVELADIEPENWLVVDKRSESGAGLINVLPFGATVTSQSLEYSGELVIDAAASLATQPRGLTQLSKSQAIVFSLHATKALAGAEGGLVVFGSAERAERARSWINFGFTGSRDAVSLGFNGKMSEYDAAVVNARLDGWPDEAPEWFAARKKSLLVTEQIGLEATPEAMRGIGPYWVALFNSSQKREFALRRLKEAGIETRLWWGSGLHRMPAFADIKRGPLVTVEDLSQRYLGLPFFLDMTSKDFGRISDLLSSGS